MISAPEATDPTTVMSPSRQTIDWPDRTFCSMSMLTGSAGLLEFGGNRDFVRDGERNIPAAAQHRRHAGIDHAGADTFEPDEAHAARRELADPALQFRFAGRGSPMSSTTVRPVKKPGERCSQTSKSANHCWIGASATSVIATNERPRKRMDGPERLTALTVRISL